MESPQSSRCNSKQVFVDQNCEDFTGNYEGAVFNHCSFKNLNGLSLVKCDLSGSKFITDEIKDALDFTVTLNCLSFQDVEYSETLFDLLLCLMIKSKGNAEKRKQLIGILGEDKLKALLRVLHKLE